MTLVLVVSLVVILMTLHNWRQGIIALLAVGVLQDILRKLDPNTPAWYIMWSAGLFVFILLWAWYNKKIGDMRPLYLNNANLRAAWIMFFFILVFQSLNSMLRWGSLPLVVLGLVTYVAPIAALLLSIAYVNSERQLQKFMKAYIWVMIPAVMTVYLSPDYSDSWRVLRDIGTFEGKSLIIYDMGRALDSYPGVFRTGEMAAWHAATAICFLYVLASQNRSLSRKIFSGLAIVLLLGAIILTGRRKMIMAISVFFVLHWGLTAFYSKGGGKGTIAIMVLGLIGSLMFGFLQKDDNLGAYSQRGLTVFSSVGGRLDMSLNLMESAFYRSQFIGLGLGVTGQGARFVSVNTGAEGAAEAGLGKILVEFGIPGTIVLVWLLSGMGLRLLGIFRVLGRSDPKLFFYAASFFSLLAANAATFSVATQIYSDPFVLIILGLVSGFLFAICRVAINSQAAARRQLRVPIIAARQS